MNVGKSVRNSIDAWENGDNESAMLHACNAVDGTAKKTYPSLGSNSRFTKLLRDNYVILGAMGMPGIDLDETRFPVVVERPKALGGQPDVADVIYGIHRCCHGHGEELPGGFELIEDAKGPVRRTRVSVVRGAIRLSDRMIFALIAVAVLSDVNTDQSVPEGYFLAFGASDKLLINDWWGRVADFSQVVTRKPMPKVKLDFTDWMT